MATSDSVVTLEAPAGVAAALPSASKEMPDAIKNFFIRFS
jgi:hypothetical protein